MGSSPLVVRLFSNESDTIYSRENDPGQKSQEARTNASPEIWPGAAALYRWRTGSQQQGMMGWEAGNFLIGRAAPDFSRGGAGLRLRRSVGSRRPGQVLALIATCLV